MGLFGPNVQVLAPAVWRTLRDAIATGARSVDALIDALGGVPEGEEVPEYPSAFTLECALSVLSQRDDVREHDTVRYMVSPEAGWRSAKIRVRPHGLCVDGKLLNGLDWWYKHVSPAERPRDVPPILSLDTPPTPAGLARAAALLKLEELEAVSELIKIIADNDAAAAMCVLAINENQTDTERAAGTTIERNGRGFSAYGEDRRAAKLVDFITSGTVLSSDDVEACRDISINHALQVLRGGFLPHVLSARPGGLRAATEDESDDDGDDLGDFVEDDDVNVVNVPEGYAETHAAWTELGANESVYRGDHGVFLTRAAYEWFVALADTHRGSHAALHDALKRSVPDLTPTGACLLIAQMREPPSSVGDRVNVFWGDRFYSGTVKAIRRPGFAVVAYDDGEVLHMDPMHHLWCYRI